MKKILPLLLFISFCALPENDNSVSTEVQKSTDNIETTSTTLLLETTDLEEEASLLISDIKTAKYGAVRITVNSVQVELNDNAKFDEVNYEGSGSGFFISSDGYIITNNHVVAGAVTIEVHVEGEKYPFDARIVGMSECDDIAVLKIDYEEAYFFEFLNEDPEIGEEILAIGFPKGDLEVTYLNGIISKERMDGSNQWSSVTYAFEHTAEILPGSSGGPIINSDSKVIGVAYAGNEDRQEFAIPSVVINDTITQIIENEFDGSFGINAEQFMGGGLYIYSVEPNSPFSKAGFTGGEVITEINGFNIVDEGTLGFYCNALKTRGSDAKISFKGIDLRKSQEFEASVSLDGKNTEFNFVTSPSTTKPKVTTTVQTTTTTTTLKKPFFSSEILSLYIDSYDGKTNRIFTRYFDDIRVGIFGNPSNDDFETIRRFVQDVSPYLGNTKISLDNNNSNLSFYFLPTSQWDTVLNNDGTKACTDPETNFYEGKLWYRGNSIDEYINCFKIGSEYENDFSYASSQTIKECRLFHIRGSLVYALTGSFRNADPEKHPNTFFASQYCDVFQKVSTKDFLAIQVHYSEYVKNSSTVEEVYNLLK